jgi:hypothetical protein
MAKTNGTNGRAKKNGTATRRKQPKLTPEMEANKWKPGQSGNPGGRPKGSSVAARIQRLLAADDGKAAEALAKVFLSQGLNADFKFAKEVIDRADGKVADRIAGHDGGPLIRQVTFDVDRM